MAHTLTITRPDGRELVRICDELRQVANEIRWLLNGHEFKIPRADCTGFAATVIDQPAGTVVTHERTGLAFTVTPTPPPTTVTVEVRWGRRTTPVSASELAADKAYAQRNHYTIHEWDDINKAGQAVTLTRIIASPDGISVALYETSPAPEES